MHAISKPLVVLFVTVLVAFLAAWNGYIVVNTASVTSADVGAKLLSLIFFALVIERAVEVFISNEYGVDDLRLRRWIRIARNKIMMLEESLNIDAARPTQPGADAKLVDTRLKTTADMQDQLAAARGELAQAVENAQDGLEKLRVKKARSAAAVSVFLSVLVAAAGVRVFANFVEMTQGVVSGPLANQAGQLAVFRFADVIITALLLAGGADGIHKIVSQFKVMEKDIKS